ncbi:hypothetical protein ISCGN_031749 [Ixodes scapularis]
MVHVDQNPNAAAATEDVFCEAREATLSYLIAVLVLLLVFLCFVLGFCAYQTRQGARRQRKRRRKTCRRHRACHYCKSEEGRYSRSSACLRLGGEDGSPVSLLVRRGSTSSAGWASPFHPRFNSPASSSSSSLQPSVLGTELSHPEPTTDRAKSAGRNRRVTLATVHGPEASDQSRVSSLEWDNFQTSVATSKERLIPDLCSTARQDTEGHGGSSESCTTVVLLDTREHWL